MAVDYTTTALVEVVKRRATAPSSQNLLKTAQLILFLSETLVEEMLPELVSAREEWFVTSSTQTLVAGTDTYAIPSTSIGAGLRYVAIKDSSTGELTRMDRIDPELVMDSPRRKGYYLRGSKLVFYPPPSYADTLQLGYMRKPNLLCDVVDAGKVDSIDTGTNEVTLVSAPGSWVAGTVVDAVSATPFFDVLGESLTISAVDTTTITLPSIPAGLTAGDWICPTGYSTIPQLPPEAHPVLAQGATAKALDAMGFQEEAQAAFVIFQRGLEKLLSIMQPRTDDPKKVNSNRGIFFYSKRGY